MPTAAVLIDPEQGPVLRFEATGEAAFFGRELSFPIDPAAGLLRWAWRVDKPIATAELRIPSLDDSPARFFVIFGRPGFLRRPRILFYTWGGPERTESYWSNPTDPQMAVLVLRNADDPVRRWVMEERDLQSDFRRVFGGEPPDVYGIGFMIDAEDTGEVAVGLLGPVTWVRH